MPDPSDAAALNWHLWGPILGGIIVLICILWFIGRSNGRMNYISVKIDKVASLDTKYSVYVSVSCLGRTIHTTSIRKDENFNEWFSWSFRSKFYKQVKADHLVFELYESKSGDEPSPGDLKLASFEIPIQTLADAGLGVAVERDLTPSSPSSSSNLSLEISATADSVHSWVRKTDRFMRAWRRERTLISFYGRIISGLVAYYVAEPSLAAFKEGRMIVGWFHVGFGLYFASLMLPHYLDWIGITWLDKIKVDSLPAIWAVSFSQSAGMQTANRWFENAFVWQDHYGLWAMGGLFVLADLRGEPGCGWLSYAGRCLFGKWRYVAKD